MKNTRFCFPALLTCCKKSKQRKEAIEDKRSAACRQAHSLARQRDRRRAAARPLCDVRADSRPCGRTDDQARVAFYSATGCCSTAAAAAAFFGRPASLLGAPASLLGAARFPAFRWPLSMLVPKQRGQCDQHTCKSSQNGATALLASLREWSGAWTGCQANPAPLPARSPGKVGASASAPA